MSNAAVAIPGYSIETDLRGDRTDTTNGIGGGLMVYSREGVKILSYDKFSNSTFNQFCCFKVVTKGYMLNIVLVYRPPSAGQENTEQLCEILRQLEVNTILIGDINMPGIDWINNRSDTKGRELLRTTEEEGISQLVSFPTHYKGNILDLVLTNVPDRVTSISDVGRLGKSDHVMLEILAGKSCEVSRRTVKSWNKADWNSIRRETAEVPWRTILAQGTVQEAWDIFKNHIEDLVKKYVPTHTLRSRQRPVWLTAEVMRLIRQKRRKWRVFKERKTADCEREYKMAEKEVAKKIRNGKRKMERELVSGPDKNSRKFSKYIQSKTKSRTKIGPLRTDDGMLVDNDRDMACVLNNFFKSVFTLEDTSNIPVIRAETDEDLSSVTINRQNILKKIHELRINAATGPDNISPRILKELADVIVLPLEILFNRSLNEGELPSDWKTANVTPIFKKGVKGDPGNYRPVSLTSVPGKILEGVIKEQMMTHLLEHNLIRKSQHGFYPGKSCTTNLLVFQDRVTKAVDEGNPVDIIFLDFSKAFDKVPRERLLAKLRAKGISGKLNHWLRNWLTGRRQRVVIS